MYVKGNTKKNPYRRVDTMLVALLLSLFYVVRGFAGLVTAQTWYVLSCFCSRLQSKFYENVGTVVPPPKTP